MMFFPIAVTYIRSSVLDFLKRRFSNPGILVVYFQVGEVSQCIKIWSDRCLEDAIVTHLGWHLLRCYVYSLGGAPVLQSGDFLGIAVKRSQSSQAVEGKPK